ncbi:MAG: hypothetical protein EHM79_02385 [Geobacter sp.]|nr:MAG: hypothetical protein EHM79_02385 [Geobacter sp.]
MKTKVYFYLLLTAAAILVLIWPEGSRASSLDGFERPGVEAPPRGGALEGSAGSSRRGEAAPAAGREMPREGRSGESGGVAGVRTTAGSVVPQKTGKISAGATADAKKKLSGAGGGSVKDMKGTLSTPGKIKDEKKTFDAGPKSDGFGYAGGKLGDKRLSGMEGMKDMKGIPGGPGDPGGKALGKEAFGDDKGGKFDPLGQSGGGYDQGLGNKGDKKLGQDGLFGKKDDKGSGYGGGRGGKKDTTGGFGKGNQDKKDSSGKKETSSDKKDDSGKKDTSESKNDDSGKSSDKGDDGKEKEKEQASGGGIGPDPGVDNQGGQNNDPLGFNPQNRNRERGNAPDTGAVGVNSGEGDRAGAGSSNVDTGASIGARSNPGMNDDQYQMRQEGMSQIEQLGTYGVDPADTGMQSGMRNAPPR